MFTQILAGDYTFQYKNPSYEGFFLFSIPSLLFNIQVTSALNSFESTEP